MCVEYVLYVQCMCDLPHYLITSYLIMHLIITELSTNFYLIDLGRVEPLTKLRILIN